MKKIITLLLIFCNIFAFYCNADSKSKLPKAFAENDAQIPAPLKQAKWISLSGDGGLYDNTNTFTLYRKKVDLANQPKNATAYITADQSYVLYVNGELVSRGPARGFQRSWPYDEVDIAKYLKKGTNIFAIRHYCGNRHTFGYLTQGFSGVLFAFDIDGKITASDRSVKCLIQQSCDRDTSPVSVQLNNREHIDLRKEPIGWKNVDFDDSQWKAPKNLRKYNVMPFFTLEPRGIPMLEFKMLPEPTLIAEGKGKVSTMQERIHNNWDLIDAEISSFTSVEKQMPVLVKASSEGEYVSYVLDFGKVVVGSPILEVEGANGGEIIDAFLDEQIDSSFKPKCNFKGSSHPAFGFRAICRKGSFSHEFYNYYAFRYAVIRVRNNTADMKLNLKVRWTAYPMQINGVFNTSDELANKIWQASAYTQRLCTLDAYVDTPWREQAQWWGDARVQAWNTFFLSGDTRVFERGIRIISMQTTPNGLTYGHAPTMAHHCILPDFSLVWIATLWDYYWQTASNKMYVNHKDVVDGIINYFENITDEKTGLPKYDDRYWLFLDWTKIQKQGQPGLLAMWYLYSLQRLSVLCEETGLTQDASIYKCKADKLKKAIQTHLLDKTDGLLCDGILPNGKRSSEKSVQMQIFARITDIDGFNYKKAKEEIILPYLRGQKDFQSAPSSYWVVYVLKQMHEDGHSKDIYNFIIKRWKEMAEWGSTYENYAGNGSRSHAWSAHPTFLLPQVLGGIVQTSAGWKNFKVKPNKFVDDATIVYPTPQGNIEVSWKKNADGYYQQKISTPQK